MREVTALRRTSAADRLDAEAVLAALPQAVLTVTRAGVISQANAAAARLLGRPAGGLVGAPVDAVVPGAAALLAARRRPARRMLRVARPEGAGPPVEAALTETAQDALVLTLRDASAHLDALAELDRRSAEVERAENRFRAVLEAAPDAIVGVDDAGRIQLVNPSAERMFGYGEGEMLGLGVDELVPAAQRAAHVRHRTGFARRPVPRAMGAGMELTAVRRDGSEFPVQVSLGPVQTDQGPLTTAMIVDITDRRRAEAELARRAAQQAGIAELGALGLEGADPDALLERGVALVAAGLDVELVKVLRLRPDRRDLLVVAAHGFAPELVGRTRLPLEGSLAGVSLARAAPVLVEDLTQAVGVPFSDLLADHRVRASAVVVIDGPDDPWGVLGAHTREPRAFTADDRTFLQGIANVLGEALARHATEARLRRQATHDPLTGLANRAELFDDLARALAHERPGTEVATVFVDLDGFKPVNDAFGHAYGDELLRVVARRLTAVAERARCVARFGGDEFILVVDGVEDRGSVLQLAERLIARVSRPVAVHGASSTVSASIGVAFARPGQGALDGAALVRRADAAMYRAKSRGSGRTAVFDDQMDWALRRRMQVERRLRRAEALDEWQVAFQPVVRMVDGALIGFEALARWPQLAGGEVSAAEFVPVAEDTGLIVPLGARILERALEHAAGWAVPPDRPAPHVAVNLSPRQVADPDIVSVVERALERSRLDPERLALELTETVLLDDSDATRETLAGLRGLGTRLFLDDFGTGYSSLTHLRRYAIDALKIDRTFVLGMHGRGADLAVVYGVATIAERLGLELVAEGVETVAQAHLLQELGCGLAQGFLYARALGPQDAGELAERAARGAPYQAFSDLRATADEG